MRNFDAPYKLTGIRLEKNIVQSAFDMPKMHSHPFHELYFLLSGERRYFIGHKIYDISPGNLIVIPKNELHRTTALNSKGYERYVLYFHEEYIDSFITSIGRNNFHEFLNSGCIQLSLEYTDKIRNNLKQIELETSSRDEYSDAMTENLLQNIIIYALRHGRKKRREKNEGADKIQEVAQFISENYASEITLHDAAAMAFMEDTYFSKKFKLLTGFGFKEYLIQTRIKAAERLLLTSDLTISEISDNCGFSSSNYFGDVFKQYAGVSPSEYRKNIYSTNTRP